MSAEQESVLQSKLKVLEARLVQEKDLRNEMAARLVNAEVLV